MKIPLHIDHDDLSSDADQRRYALHECMMRLNPKGWRTPGAKSGITKSRRKNRLTEIASNAFGV